MVPIAIKAVAYKNIHYSGIHLARQRKTTENLCQSSRYHIWYLKGTIMYLYMPSPSFCQCLRVISPVQGNCENQYDINL
jgi:hypothetical protein